MNRQKKFAERIAKTLGLMDMSNFAFLRGDEKQAKYFWHRAMVNDLVIVNRPQVKGKRMEWYFEIRKIVNGEEGGQFRNFAITAPDAETANNKAPERAREILRLHGGCEDAVIYGQCWSCRIGEVQA